MRARRLSSHRTGGLSAKMTSIKSTYMECMSTKSVKLPTYHLSESFGCPLPIPPSSRTCIAGAGELLALRRLEFGGSGRNDRRGAAAELAAKKEDTSVVDDPCEPRSASASAADTFFLVAPGCQRSHFYVLFYVQ
eukprot:PhM_4_TR8674/c0_g2_i1/m.76416